MTLRCKEHQEVKDVLGAPFVNSITKNMAVHKGNQCATVLGRELFLIVIHGLGGNGG